MPAKASPPYQAVVYFPGSNALEQKTFKDAYWERFDYIPRSGRVLVRPIMAEMYERSLNGPTGRVMTRQALLERAVLILAGGLVLMGAVVLLTRRWPASSALTSDVQVVPATTVDGAIETEEPLPSVSTAAPHPSPIGFHLEGVTPATADETA